MRRALVGVSVVVLAALVGAGVLVVTLGGDDAGDAAPPSERHLEPEQIYPSIAAVETPNVASYRPLLKRGQTLATAATPACPRYRAVRRTWAKRAAFLHESSLGARASKRAAVAYYANVTWVSQDETGDFVGALSRISGSRLSMATGLVVRRERIVASFTRDALDLCGLSAASARTRVKLERLDNRISQIIELARFDSAGPTDGVAQ